MPHNNHTLTKFDNDLNTIRTHILEMCGLVETQFELSLRSLFDSDVTVAHQVIDQEYLVDQLDEQIDKFCVTAIARQQPAASDLQSIVIATKVATLLEQIGDEAKKIARVAERLVHQGFLLKQCHSGVRLAAELAQRNLADVIDSYTHLNVFIANGLLEDSNFNDEEFDIVFRNLVQFMTDDPRSISLSLEILFVAKAIERIEKYVRHMAKLVIDAPNRYSEF